MTVISDRCKGIDNGVSEFLPRAAHSYCAFHIRQNMARFGSAAASFVWKLANGSSEHEYNEIMAALGQVSQEAQEYVINNIPREQWVRAFFPMQRYGNVTSNIAESTNSSLLKIRKYPPMKLFVKVIQKINATFEERRAFYGTGNPTGIVDNVWAVVAKNIEGGRRLAARNIFGDVFNIDSQAGRQISRIVDLGKRTCSCMLFQDLGYPCIHVCSAALQGGVDIRALCIDERRVGALRRVYEVGIIPVDIETIQPIPLEPPVVHRQAGRPKVKRTRRKNEDHPKRISFCSLCRQSGHNAKTCPEKQP